jgi:S-adenosylmethionine:tRNA ribosyltransferase-isomerase
VVAIGTTSTRTLEHVYADPAVRPWRDGDPGLARTGSTDLLIAPGHTWACVGALLTNFHLPRSTLIALVMAMHGVEATKAAYAAAIAQRLRFYSFGDAMFIHGAPVRATLTP